MFALTLFQESNAMWTNSSIQLFKKACDILTNNFSYTYNYVVSTESLYEIWYAIWIMPSFNTLKNTNKSIVLCSEYTQWDAALLPALASLWLKALIIIILFIG